jgi:K+-sensing histidine kinase KdpD
MGRYTIETELSPEQAISEAKAYFGEGGLGLAVAEESSCKATLTGGGGCVTVTADNGGDKTNVELQTGQLDDYVWQFVLTSLASASVSVPVTVENTRTMELQRRRIAELEARNKELEAFAHAVAHDLKAPLALVLGFAELLREDCDGFSGEELAKYLGLITRNGRQMKDTIDGLLSSAETH